ncbi:CHAT domain-containing protein [Geodermatophilus sp. SYSU D00697]
MSLEFPVIGDQAGYDFGCDTQDAVFRKLAEAVPEANSVRAAGELLFKGLATNPHVEKAFGQAVLARVEDRFPVLLELRGDETIEALPWETLYVPDGGFLGLDARWSVGRRVDSRESRPVECLLPSTLQMAVVLSCLDIPAEDEWARLRAAVDDSGLSVEVLVFVGEPELAEALERERIPWLRGVKGIPASAEELRTVFAQERSAGFTPQILHFFTHGSTEGGPHLEVATPTDWEVGATQSSLTLDPVQVRDLTEPETRPWLVVLNSCLGAAPVTDDRGAATAGEARARQREATHSLARELVREGGFPAVVGMREPIETSDATLFSSHFYPQLFDALAALPRGTPTTLDWSKLLVQPRRGLAEHAGKVIVLAAGERKQWTLPVLYVRGQELLITRAGDDAGADGGRGAPEVGSLVPQAGPPAVDPVVAAKLELLREVLEGLSADAPERYRDDLMAHIRRLESGAA